MRYLNEMLEKSGFSDGEAPPVGIGVFRKCYVRAINFFAGKLGSGWRAVAFDRPGAHNGCMILFCPAAEVAGATCDWVESGSFEVRTSVPLYRTDQAFQDAVEEAGDFNPDDYIEVKTDLDIAALDQEMRKHQMRG